MLRMVVTGVDLPRDAAFRMLFASAETGSAASNDSDTASRQCPARCRRAAVACLVPILDHLGIDFAFGSRNPVQFVLHVSGSTQVGVRLLVAGRRRSPRQILDQIRQVPAELLLLRGQQPVLAPQSLHLLVDRLELFEREAWDCRCRFGRRRGSAMFALFARCHKIKPSQSDRQILTCACASS